jgi:hypothetical protein
MNGAGLVSGALSLTDQMRSLVEHSNRRVSVLRWEPPQSVLNKKRYGSQGKKQGCF